MKWRSKKAANEAIQASEKQLQQVRAQQPEVTRIVHQLRQEGERNHFAERLQMHYRGTQ